MSRYAFFSALAFLPGVIFASSGSFGGERVAAIRPMVIDRPAAYWRDSGFAEMTPPIRLPSNDGKESIVVWLRIPDGARLGVAAPDGAEPTLSYPPGTVADRLDIRNGENPESVSDVRGTRFEDGEEFFHVFRSFDALRLEGLEWRRGDAVAEQQATYRLLERMAGARGLTSYQDDPALLLFEKQNACETCHAHDKAERRSYVLDNASDDKSPNRSTDHGGLYAVAAVLKDGAPLETHRARDMNEGDPFVRVTCADGNPANVVVKARGRRRQFACEDESVPYARLDVAAALADGDSRAAAVCRSRAYLADHMDEKGRDAYRGAFNECGLP